MQLSYGSISRRIAAFLFGLSVAIAAGAAADHLPGVPNFHKVNSQVYRGGQPTAAGFAGLARLGVRTVVDLRRIGEHSQEEERRAVESNGMRYVSLPMKGMSTPTEGQISEALALLQDPQAQPVFVHCHRGADRTGAVIACYRMSHDGWTGKKALHEARTLGMRWYQRALQKYVIRYKTPKPADAGAVAAGTQ